ncbi:uncharacterized protein LOC118191188 [Stegodyphus dumicola]|uniref:uncharacterized protein LOC118191188 n=1 Tax=Stegodyphus dumicola TaxID=202533 RepID=UPI0015AAB2B1|nr:uncharacterized protein LOC118191188 [Stegodyphus dumicola]
MCGKDYLLCFSFLTVTVLIRTMKGCSDGYFRASSSICLHFAEPTPNREKYCITKGGKFFSQPLTDEAKEDIAKAMKEVANDWMPNEAYIGFQKELDPWQKSKTWVYDGTEESIEEDDYRMWIKKPDGGNDRCAGISQQQDFGTKPVPCSEAMGIICQKDNLDKCFEKEMNYSIYDGSCLFVKAEPMNYQTARDSCGKGHLVHVRNEGIIEAIKQAFYNSRFGGGVYIGLEKNEKGEWLYKDGQ